MSGAIDVIVEGLDGTEGPVLLADGRVACIHGDGVIAVDVRSARVERLATCGADPNGLALSADGKSIYVANNGLICRPGKVPGRIERIGVLTGSVAVLADGLDAPNDICLGPDGALWFTDPMDCWFHEELRPGRVYRLELADGAEPTLVHEGLDFPNGLGFAPDGRLIVAESRTSRLWAVDVADGSAAEWVTLPSGAPDGFAFLADGACAVCCFDVGRIYRVSPQGNVDGMLDIGEGTWPTNCCVLPDGSLAVTESKGGRLLRVRPDAWEPVVASRP